MPWSYVLFAFLFLCVILFVLHLLGLAPLWVAGAAFLALLVVYRVWDKKTDVTDKTWGEGARGEFRVGAELERLHEHGFHIFHDWDSGRGNVDHFVVGPTGVFAIETKAWTGSITAENG
jgi:Ca2+/Na+ antiporter